jgi:putative redox protein
MRSAVARRQEGGYAHELQIREHRLFADEPEDRGGSDKGPTPTELLAAALASCTAITLEMYADRKDWDLGAVEVAVDFEEPSADKSASFKVKIRVGARLSDEQRERLLVIAGKCPVHKTLAASDTEISDELELIEE